MSKMPTVHLVCGGTGAGKTTYSLGLAQREHAIRFSIDPWMQTLFGDDKPKALNFEWMMERITRSEAMMWQVVEQLLERGINVVLDLGFTTREHRFRHRAQAEQRGASVHFVDVPSELRRARVTKRNEERDPQLFAFEVTEQMFAFMEPRFEPPDQEELATGLHIK